MDQKKLHLHILGSGSAGHALAEAFSVLKLRSKDLDLGEVRFLPRGTELAAAGDRKDAILAVANPHALHAPTILQAEAAGYCGAIVEKPAAISLSQIETLRAMKMPVAVCHGYRTFWGPETLRELVASGELGSLISIEGRYWQSSAAQKRVKAGDWKNETALSGPYDVLIDLASHWLDLATFVGGVSPESVRVWKSYANAGSSHRDTHVHVATQTGALRTFGSVSKTVHGAGNHLEIQVLGENARASWVFSDADRVEIGRGKDVQWVARSGDNATASRHSPFHGLGWLDGYIEVMHRFLCERRSVSHKAYPTLKENTELLARLFTAQEL